MESALPRSSAPSFSRERRSNAATTAGEKKQTESSAGLPPPPPQQPKEEDGLVRILLDEMAAVSESAIVQYEEEEARSKTSDSTNDTVQLSRSESGNSKASASSTTAGSPRVATMMNTNTTKTARPPTTTTFEKVGYTSFGQAASARLDCMKNLDGGQQNGFMALLESSPVPGEDLSPSSSPENNTNGSYRQARNSTAQQKSSSSDIHVIFRDLSGEANSSSANGANGTEHFHTTPAGMKGHHHHNGNMSTKSDESWDMFSSEDEGGVCERRGLVGAKEAVTPKAAAAAASAVASTAIEEEEDGVEVESRCSTRSDALKRRGVRILGRSPMSVRKRMASTPRLDINELKLGKRLGSGAFGEVLEVESVARRLHNGVIRRLSTMNRSSSAVGDHANHHHDVVGHKPLGMRKAVCGFLFPDKRAGNRKRYVLKRVKRNYSKGMPKDHLEKAMIDFSNETNILKTVDHPNIIGLHATSSFDDSDQSNGERFILLDRLHETLCDRLERWAKIEKRHKWWRNNPGLQGKRPKMAESDLRIEKLVVARDIAGALDYLHQRNIIYRDLKAENVGFDEDGTLKLFDFGLAVDVTDKMEVGIVPQTGEPVYALEGVGTPRYIAPEIARFQPYNFKVDVYSFGILLWEMLTHKTPFNGLKPDMMLKLVMKGRRPPMEPMEHCPAALKDLVTSCWSNKIANRKDFGTIYDILDDMIKDAQGEVCGNRIARARAAAVVRQEDEEE